MAVSVGLKYLPAVLTKAIVIYKMQGSEVCFRALLQGEKEEMTALSTLTLKSANNHGTTPSFTSTETNLKVA